LRIRSSLIWCVLPRMLGCKVGTTSNGTLLNRDIIARLINEGLGIIGFSLVGVDEKNDRIRQGTRTKTVLACMEEIHRAKQRYGSDTPAIHIAYMLLRSGLDELEKIPKFLSHTGADQTVISSLSFVARTIRHQNFAGIVQNKILISLNIEMSLTRVIQTTE
jgi:sulfatase maturation enzyme AslB (radical SAM superfamily)